jgi:hypothetical protein
MLGIFGVRFPSFTQAAQQSMMRNTTPLHPENRCLFFMTTPFS